MPLTIPGEYLMQPFTKMRSAATGRIIISRTFQKVLGELAMSRFITFTGGVLSESDVADRMWESLLRAYVHFVGMPFILNYSGRLIYINDNLRPFFEQWETSRWYFEERERQKWAEVEDGDWKPYRDQVLTSTGYSKPLYDKFNPRSSLLNVERYKSARLLEMQETGGLNENQLCDLSTKHLAEASGPASFFFMQAKKVPLVSVFIGMDVVIIFSNIQLLTIYRKAFSKRYQTGHIPAWLKYQSTRATTTAGFKDKQYFDDRGKIKLTIPFAETLPNMAKLDTYGLITRIDLTRFTGELVIAETWTYETMEPPTFEMVIAEAWTYEAPPEPPEVEVAIFEKWTQTEPPDMVELFTEKWGTPPPYFGTAPYFKEIFSS